MEYYMPGPTDLQYKDELRKDRQFCEDILELIEAGRTDELVKMIQKRLKRIGETLLD